jgi:hypothetical protein
MSVTGNGQEGQSRSMSDTKYQKGGKLADEEGLMDL